jgi:hypothetical protein
MRQSGGIKLDFSPQSAPNHLINTWNQPSLGNSVNEAAEKSHDTVTGLTNVAGHWADQAACSFCFLN